MKILKDLKPEKVFEYFELICSVPHGSGNMDAICGLCEEFAKERGLRYLRDESRNIVIWKDGTPGREKEEPVILQGHLDMVCAKAPGCTKDMGREGPSLVLDGEWIRADGTSLGGDDGIAVAVILAVLDSGDLSHPPIEAVFTSDEEVGLIGAGALDYSVFKGRRMINIDSDEEGVFTVGCAGGITAEVSIPCRREPVMDGMLYRVKVKGLLGGHSGGDIDKGRANAGKLLARLLYEAGRELPLRLLSLNGGKFGNVIMPECEAVAAVRKGDSERFLELVKHYEILFRKEYDVSEPDLAVTAERTDAYWENGEGLTPEEADARAAAEAGTTPVLTLRDTANVLGMLLTVPQGVWHMSFRIPGLVQSSMNLGVAELLEDELKCTFLLRSSLGSERDLMLHTLGEITESAGGKMETNSAYPAWEVRSDSPLRDLMSEVFRTQTGKDPVITATHGGLECGLFYERLPGLDCISIGPDLRDIHSEYERLSVPSVGRLYALLTETLARLSDGKEKK